MSRRARSPRAPNRTKMSADDRWQPFSSKTSSPFDYAEQAREMHFISRTASTTTSRARRQVLSHRPLRIRPQMAALPSLCSLDRVAPDHRRRPLPLPPNSPLAVEYAPIVGIGGRREITPNLV